MTPSYSIGFALLITLIFAVVPTAGAEPTIAQHTTSQEIIYSVVISGGTVYDGLGAEGVRTDVGILGDRIAAIGDLSVARAARRIDATMLAVVPGFIDIHSHATSGSPESSGVVQRPLAENYVRQGVTTVMGGQDGSSPIQIGEFLAYLDAAPSAINVGLFVGHGSIRGRIMGQEERDPTVSELADMVSLVERAMLDGAFGLSSGLEYTPGSYANLDELIALAGPLAKHNGLYISHIRDEGAHVLESISEVIRVGEEAGIAAQVTHMRAYWQGTAGSSLSFCCSSGKPRAKRVSMLLPRGTCE